MEYLMTYGWAILIIAVVLGVLFQIGFFNSMNFAPRTPPGACQVLRPGGIGTTSFINLEGECTGELPQYVFRSGGVGDYIEVPGSNNTSSPLNIQQNLTITAWIYITGSPYHDVIDKENQYGVKIDYNNQPHSCYPSNFEGFCLEWDTINNWIGPGYAIPNATFKKWIFVGVNIAYNSTTGNSIKQWFADGQEIGNSSVSGKLTYSNSVVSIGAISPGYTGYGDAEWFNGSIANVQIYNAALSANEIQSLYREGIGGAPVDLQNLVAWWPLNGNAKDYSGNGNNGVPTNVVYTNNWWSNYTLP
ncbi:MAG: LamG-like jellyroll fold domain-containing protein [Candidatus Micrarchaeia archaeon]